MAGTADGQDQPGPAIAASGTATDQIVIRVIDDQLTDFRPEDLYRIGVDEISYRRGHAYLTIVADHDTGDVVWVGRRESRSIPGQILRRVAI